MKRMIHEATRALSALRLALEEVRSLTADLRKALADDLKKKKGQGF